MSLSDPFVRRPVLTSLLTVTASAQDVRYSVIVPGNGQLVTEIAVFNAADALNDAAFSRYIGDRNVRTEDDARAYIRTGAMASYAQHGHGLYLVESKELHGPIGTCGILRRKALPDPDLGFAFAADHRGKGFGKEAASAMLAHARELGMPRLAAIVSPENEPSRRLLEGLGFGFQRMVRMAEDEPEILYLVRELSA